jgi:hypothetical protein
MRVAGCWCYWHMLDTHMALVHWLLRVQEAFAA